MSESLGSKETHSHHTHSYEMYRKQRACKDEVDQLAKSPAKVPLEKQTSLEFDRLLHADSKSHYTSETYQCTDRDCELGSGCKGDHSCKNETLRIKFGIVPKGMPPANSDYWPYNWYRRKARKLGLPRSYDNVDSDYSDSNDDDGGCCPSKKTKSPNKDFDKESQS